MPRMNATSTEAPMGWKFEVSESHPMAKLDFWKFIRERNSWEKLYNI